MKKFVKGKYIEMTREEVEALKNSEAEHSKPTTEDRLTAVENFIEKVSKLFNLEREETK